MQEAEGEREREREGGDPASPRSYAGTSFGSVFACGYSPSAPVALPGQVSGFLILDEEEGIEEGEIEEGEIEEGGIDE